ncbi:MAG: pyridoxamine 5'-phosphate oxidase [Deltaproteobacteria bacterium]|nr:pyridoxamine 5'-phosphate oxidase [Deltaproteobacteria bacterium]
MRPGDRSVDPIRRFQSWFAQAARAGERRPEEMALATADRRGAPAVRYVLLRGIDERGFVFYTDGRSRKGAEIRANPRAALALYWGGTGKQVRIEGAIEEVEPELVDAYWARRSREKRLAAASSRQDAPLARRADLLERFRALRALYRAKELPRPAAWTGFRVIPDTIEFWIRRAHRLHHRELFVRRAGVWRRRLLQP